jgi:hypothetical protein
MNHIYEANIKNDTEKCKTCGCIREPKTVGIFSGFIYTRDKLVFNGEPSCVDWEKHREEDYRQEDSWEDDLFFEFEPCSYCDLPDVCSDFADCAIKSGIRKPPIGYNGIF